MRIAVFDNGHLRNNPELANQMMSRLLYIMREGKEISGTKEALVGAHDSVWLRIVEVCRTPTSTALANGHLEIIPRYENVSTRERERD
jgi:hypothetical protein